MATVAKPTAKSIATQAASKYGSSAASKISSAMSQIKPATSSSGSGGVSSIKNTSSVSPVSTNLGSAPTDMGSNYTAVPAKVTNVSRGTTNTNVSNVGSGVATGANAFGEQNKKGLLLSNGQQITDKSQIGPVSTVNNKYGDEAMQMEQASPGYIKSRTDEDAKALVSIGGTDDASIKKYLETRPGFLGASPEDQANTIASLKARIGEFGQPEIPTGTDGAMPSPENDPNAFNKMIENDYAMSQAEIVQSTESDKTYMQQQEEIRKQTEAMSSENAQIASSERLRKANEQLSNLKQSVAFLGNQGRPGVSTAHFDAIQQQLQSAEMTYQNMQRVEANMSAMDKLGIKYNAQAFEKQMGDLQDQLDSQVSTEVQNAINKLNVDGGKIDTLEELATVKGTIFQELDKRIANFAIANKADRKLIIDRTNEIIQQGEIAMKERVLREQEAKTIDMAVSKGLGFMANKFGEQIVGVDGQPIPMPEEPVRQGIDEATGNFISVSKGKDGQLQTTMTKVMNPAGPKPEAWKETSTKGVFSRTNANGELEFSKAPGVGQPGSTATGQLVTSSLGGRDVTLDSSAMPSLESAVAEMEALGIPVLIPQSLRDKETQAQLVKEGKSWTMDSKHLTGQAIDLYEGDPSKKPNLEQVSIMNKNGWFQPEATLKKGDYGHFEFKGATKEADINDVVSFNDAVSRRDMSAEDKNRIGEQKKKIMSDPNSSIEDILNRSQGGKTVGAEQSKSFAKYEQAMSGLDAVQEQISDMDTGPIMGKLRSINPRDTDAQVLKTMLKGLVPTVARGVYGEVGVLTDSDVKQYSATLPNLESTDDINKAVLAYTLDVMAGGYKKQLRSLAGQGYDVSGMVGTYEDIKNQADTLRADLGIGDQANQTQGQGPLAPGQGGADRYNQTYSDSVKGLEL